MPDKQEIELFITEDGELKVHIKGVKGHGCLKSLEAMAGQMGELKDKQLTSEYYEQVKNKNTNNNKIR